MSRPDPVYFHSDAAVPFLVTRLVSLFLAAMLSYGILWGYEKLAHREPTEPAYFIILLSVVSLLEYSANSLKINSVPAAVRLYWFLSKLRDTLARYTKHLRPRFARGSFYLISAAMLTFVTWEASIGWNKPTVTPETQRDLVVAGLTLAVGIVAIFFTVLGLVVQRTMEDYSPSFVTVIAKNGVYILFFVLSLITALLDLWILVRGLNPDLVIASVAGSFYCALSVPFLVSETFQNLDVSNVIHKIARRTVREARRKIKEQPPILRADPSKSDPNLLPVQTILKQFFEKWISGSMRPRSAMPLFDVPEQIIVPLQERVRSITNTTLKAIALDQREVVLTCLGSMSQIVDAYAKARSSYEGQTDRFLLFISDQIQIIFNASLKSPNEQYSSDVTSCVADFAASTLQLTQSIQGRYPENSHVGIFCGVLQTIAVRAFQLQHSDASPKACEYLGRIGTSLIAKEAYQPALYTVADGLQAIGQFVSLQVGAWPGLVCQTSLAQLTLLLHATIQQTIKSEHYYSVASKVLLEKTEAIVEKWYERGHSHLDNQTVVGPLVGGLWVGTKWTKIVAAALRGALTEDTTSPILEDVSNIVRALNHLGVLAIQKGRTPQYEYFVALSEITYEAVKLAAKSSKNPRTANDAFKLVDKSFHAALQLLNVSYSCHSYQGFEDLFRISATWAFLITAYQQTKAARLVEIYAQATEGLISIVQKSPPKGQERNYEFSELYKYIKLFGAWLYRYCPEHDLNKKILLFLARNHELQRFGLRHSSYSPMGDIGYPTESIAGAWYVHPSEHWTNEQWTVTRELNHIPSYKAYDRLVRKIALRLGSFVKFVSHSIP